MTVPLPYKVECKSLYPYFETIAAFDCIAAAIAYAGECALTRPGFSYRVKRGRETLSCFRPEGTV